MFKFLKRLFQEEETAEVNLSEVSTWLDQEANSLSLNHYLKEYFRQLESLKNQLKDKVQTLQTQEIKDKDREQVEGRIINIVVGHRDHYVLEVERFLNELLLPDKEYQNIEDFKEAWEFNNRLNIRFDRLAKATAKSYQATQHLFFDQVEPVFKTLGETNSLAKEFPGNKIENLIKIKGLVSQMQEEKEKKELLINSIKEKKDKIVEFKKSQENSEKELKELKEGASFAEYNNLKKNLERLKEQYNQVENEIHSFFSKLQKPLKKYERIAIDNKPIHPYLENSLEAFWADQEFKINEVLQGLKKSLMGRHLEFDQRQKDNFTALIEKSEAGYLLELRKRGELLKSEKNRTEGEIGSMVIAGDIKSTRGRIAKLAEGIIGFEKDIDDLQLKMEKISSQKVEEEFSEQARELFKKEVILKSS